ncbi:hypothetical protein M413DRAFT_248710 [Hebeloma cylindrosporum]|uniref:Uncharacterized protein n=1 Tax=Hebeloma cylindrosporum TaxID=76867 RepID=A0A0C3BNM4_HEBCY|nr:hypothetical protein M413DRAFT_248710 [Hebeloma cylindrosporum h7]
MVNNDQSAQPRHALGPSLSLVNGAADFTTGDCILIRIPDLDGQLGEHTSTYFSQSFTAS